MVKHRIEFNASIARPPRERAASTAPAPRRALESWHFALVQTIYAAPRKVSRNIMLSHAGGAPIDIEGALDESFLIQPVHAGPCQSFRGYGSLGEAQRRQPTAHAGLGLTATVMMIVTMSVEGWTEICLLPAVNRAIPRYTPLQPAMCLAAE
jgi:hypothetical protein